MKNKEAAVIWMYHGISSSSRPYRNTNSSELFFVITETLFRQQLQFLRDGGYNVVLLDTLARYYESGQIPPKTVVLTFDDGHESNYWIAFPLLKEFGFKAVFFITTDWINTSPYMTDEMIQELRYAGMSIQSHGKTHRRLTEIGKEETREELTRSREHLSTLTQLDVTNIAFPGGFWNEDTVQLARELGYSVCCNSVRGYNDLSSDIFHLRRFDLNIYTDFLYFKAVLNFNSLYFVIRNLKHTIVKLSRMVSGMRQK